MTDKQHILLICEYLGVAHGLNGGMAADYAKANGLALRCMAELPSELWERVIKAIQAPRYQSVLAFVAELRAETFPFDPIPERLYVRHGPGAGATKH